MLPFINGTDILEHFNVSCTFAGPDNGSLLWEVTTVKMVNIS